MGNTATLINFGDRNNYGLETAATGTAKKFNASGSSAVWTPTSVLSAWATAFDLSQESNWLGLAPILTFDGTNDGFSTPDITYFSRGDGANDSVVSIVVWVYFKATGSNEILFSKSNTGLTSDSEYQFLKGGGELLGFVCRDASVPINVSRDTSGAITVGAWHCVAMTYAGTGGATAMNGAAIYVDGAAVTSAATNQATYVAMENGAQLNYIGSRSGSLRFNGKMLGGPWSPLFVQAELTAEQIANLYQVERLGLGV